MAIQVLRTLVIVLGVLILVVLGAVIWTAFDGPRSGDAARDAGEAAPDPLTLGLPSPDCVIEAASTDAGRLTIITVSYTHLTLPTIYSV